jgi:glutathione synthase/RimK-type ligase-like ATP-grasp enzyme
MTHEKLQKYSIPTVALEGSSTVAITKSLLSLQQLKKNHDHTIDFSSQIIVKDRNGAGGNHIYKVHGSDTVKIKSILRDNLALKFVIQPFILFDKGYSHKEQHGLTDIRLIFFNQKVVQAYIRIAKKDDFRCNEHKGGLLEYIALKDIPKDIIDKSKQILKSLQTKSSLYALDFIVSNNGNTFFMEGNTGPGLDWNESKKINERKAKQLIHLIVEEFIQRTEIYALQAVSKISLPEKMYLPVSQVLKIPSI